MLVYKPLYLLYTILYTCELKQCISIFFIIIRASGGVKTFNLIKRIRFGLILVKFIVNK
jgi:hypothetical protein